MTRTVQFTQAQVRRAVKAAESAGLRVTGVTIRPDGSISVESVENRFVHVDEQEKALAASWDDV